MNSTINWEEEGRRSHGPVTQGHLSAAMENSIVQNAMIQRLNQTKEVYGKGQSDVAKTLGKVSLILEDTNRRGTKHGSNKEEDDTEEVVLMERTLTIMDDNHDTLDYEVNTTQINHVHITYNY